MKELAAPEVDITRLRACSVFRQQSFGPNLVRNPYFLPRYPVWRHKIKEPSMNPTPPQPKENQPKKPFSEPKKQSSCFTCRVQGVFSLPSKLRKKLQLGGN